MMFHTGSVSFLIENNFNFNKLFEKGINFGRYSEEEHLRSLCRQKATKNFESVRSYSVLSQTHQKRLEEMMLEIENFVYDPNTTEDLTFQIESYSLKKALSKRVTDVYLGTGVFTEFNRQSPETSIKKSRSFKQVNFLRNVKRMSENFE